MSEKILRLLREAAELRLLGLVFEYPSEEWRRNLIALQPSLNDENSQAIAREALRDAGEGLHFALFGPAGSVPVREVKYQGGVQFGYLMAELSAFYEAFGYEPALPEAADHLAVEIGFLAYLKLKEANALLRGEEETAARTAEAANTFLREHLAVQAEPVLRGMENFGPEYLIKACAVLAELAGPSPRSGYPLGGGEDDGLCCGEAAAPELITLQPVEAR